MAVAVFPNRRRMVTGSDNKTLCLWDLETGVVLKKMEGHSKYGDFEGQPSSWEVVTVQEAGTNVGA
ncbi:hypothetical protein P692DRAFT_20881539 [Suillus brevipes Sb2]|nr:hypothetical protein P692DRAFT_20881539 [Suillus brevipes Sb2]